jgi:hypothetical protein
MRGSLIPLPCRTHSYRLDFGHEYAVLDIFHCCPAFRSDHAGVGSRANFTASPWRRVGVGFGPSRGNRMKNSTATQVEEGKSSGVYRDRACRSPPPTLAAVTNVPGLENERDQRADAPANQIHPLRSRSSDDSSLYMLDLPNGLIGVYSEAWTFTSATTEVVKLFLARKISFPGCIAAFAVVPNSDAGRRKCCISDPRR